MQNTDVLEIDGAADYLAPISELDRARKYPYHAPQGGFILNAGRLLPLTEGDLAASASAILGGRVAVLSVGSNRAPVQLLRKFGTAATVPVTPARLHDCDIVHAALIGYYAAVPCTAFPSVGTVVDLNVAWLDPEQLVQMHRTEGIGVAYDFVEMDNVEHLFTLSAAFSGALSDGPVFGYAARAGVLDCGNGQPAGLAAIPAQGRKFKTLSQDAAVTYLCQLVGIDATTPNSMADFICEMQADKAARDWIIDLLRAHALFDVAPPWRVVPVNIDGIDKYI